MSKANRLRLLLFIVIAALHGVLISFLAFNLPSSSPSEEEPTRVMKLTDIMEDIPPDPLPSPPPPPPTPEAVPENAVEAIAENMIETDKVPEDQVIVPAGTIQTPQNNNAGAAEVYLPQSKISVLPKFDELTIRQKTIYPSIARRSGIEGTVYLELFIDRTGRVQQIKILKEDPPGKGFGEAAVKAFEGITAQSPAQANGENVTVRYRYPVSFKIR
jgi:protein TonB